jgi:cytochrome c553
MFAPADWYPGDHPPMPDVVANLNEDDILNIAAYTASLAP